MISAIKRLLFEQQATPEVLLIPPYAALAASDGDRQASRQRAVEAAIKRLGKKYCLHNPNPPRQPASVVQIKAARAK